MTGRLILVFEIIELSKIECQIQVEFIILYSAKGNNQFVKLPYKIPKDDLCNFADGAFTHYGPAKTLADASDLPAPQTGVSLCTLYKRVRKIFWNTITNLPVNVF